MRRISLILASLLFLGISILQPTFAQQAYDVNFDSNTAAQIEALDDNIKQREASLLLAREQLQSLQESIKVGISAEKQITQQDLSQLHNQLSEAQIHGDNLRLRIQEVSKRIEANGQMLDQLNTLLQKQSNPLAAGDGTSEQDIAETRRSIKQNKLLNKLLMKQLDQLNEAVEINAHWQEALTQRYRSYNEHYLEQNTIDDDPSVNQTNSILHQSTLIAERNQITSLLDSTNLNAKKRLEANISIAIINKQVLFNQLLREVNNIDDRLQEIQFVDYATVSLDRIERVQAEIRDASTRLDLIETQIKQNYRVIHEQFDMLTTRQGRVPQAIMDRFSTLEKDHSQLIASFKLTKTNLDLLSSKVATQYTELSKNYLKKRFLFGSNFKDINTVVHNVGAAYGLFAGQYLVSLKTLVKSLQQMEQLHWLGLSLAMFSVFVATIVLTMWMNRVVRLYRKKSRLGFTKRLMLFLFGMIKYNLPYFGFFFLSFLLVSFTQLPSPSYGLLLLPSIAILIVTIPYFAMRILIDSRLLETTDNFRIIHIVGLLSAVVSILFAQVMLAQWTLDKGSTIDGFRWLFGAYVAAISLPMWRSVIKMVRFLNEYYGEYYAYRILRIVIFIVPIATTLFGFASLLGYLNFAWISTEHLLYLLLFAVIWIAFLALSKDLSLWAKRYALLNTNNGVFWAQDIINPAHTLLRYGSLFLLISILLNIYGWNANTPLISDFLTVLNDPLFSKNEDSQFTLMNIMLMAVLIYIVFRIGSWIKSFAYRLIFGKIADLGIRNSLAVFSQYAAITIGFLLTLRVIGIDLTALTVFAGAIGVGIGFGLQTIANNFISGIILLIERPLRNGDIISVGGYDGTVERIGMRSLTMTTFNNESVILPNSDFVTSAFKNWSHSDQIVRVILYLDINYRHDPHVVEQALMQELKEMVAAGELSEIEPDIINRAFAYNCSERGITYRVQYFFHLLDHDFFSTRHNVIRRMWHACHKHGFEIAYPKHDVFFPNHPDQLAHSIRTLPDFGDRFNGSTAPPA